MFTIQDIHNAHAKVKSGADFPKYIQDIIQIGVTDFETFVSDSHTVYFGEDNYQTQSAPMYAPLSIADKSAKEQFVRYLKIHQRGETDYPSFCKHCAETGIEKWVVNMQQMTCIYYNKEGEKVLVEKIPSL
ncbi:DUF1398 domain-containing protein [Arachidicoccus soli]|uniref:DUF1398 domain-containing protein n=1 Tax=Arachidicoccus soli TaxID=2341117 RepID=A0A386HUB2_9BACT|nr:DUF1398 family protein [Arachidicoccus soli]AYD48946.1 DUF1398 domain-containing protein [Arachidicoccus soli]